MNKNQIDNILDFYYQVAVLKEKLRQGWVYWNVTNTRIESISEHIYGSQMLAVAIYSECNLNIDIFKVMAMLALHETEEVIIDDYTPIDNISENDKLKMGSEAVNFIFSRLQKSKEFVNLIDEFNEKITPEAQFAFLCDKLDCILQIKKYSDNYKCTILSATLKVLNDTKVQRAINMGANTVLDVFIDNDRFMYLGSIIEDLFEYVKVYRIKE